MVLMFLIIFAIEMLVSIHSNGRRKIISFVVAVVMAVAMFVMIFTDPQKIEIVESNSYNITNYTEKISYENTNEIKEITFKVKDTSITYNIIINDENVDVIKTGSNPTKVKIIKENCFYWGKFITEEKVLYTFS